MREVKVTGISAKGQERSYVYLVQGLAGLDNFEALKKAIDYAKDEWICDYDENLKPCGEPYREFEKITAAVILES